MAHEFSYTDADFQQVRELIYRTAGINLLENKKQLVYSRLARRLRALSINSFPAYLHYLRQTPAELQPFINALTTNLTAFFRESHHFDILRQFVLQRPSCQPLRVWCAAASTGEEPYSIAMTLIEAYGSASPPVHIVASDIDSQVLQSAAAGIYAMDRLQSLTDTQKKQFFLRGKGRQQGQARVVDAVRQLVDFRRINLLDNLWGLEPNFDIIFCRNVMIYFDKATQLRLFARMMSLLSDDGLYVAGHSENFSQAAEVATLVGKSCYQKTGAALRYLDDREACGISL